MFDGRSLNAQDLNEERSKGFDHLALVHKVLEPIVTIVHGHGQESN